MKQALTVRFGGYCIVLALFLSSCDSTDKDIIPPNKEVIINGSATDYYTTPNSQVIIDLRSIVSESFVNAILRVSVSPGHGSLVKIDGFLLAYTSGEAFRGNDSFQVEISHEGNVLATRAITIHVSSTVSTFPCGVYAMNDYVSIYPDSVILIPVLKNDIYCDPRNAVKKISIYKQPEYGSASLAGDTAIVYTPESGRMGRSDIIYSINETSSGQKKTSFGMATVMVEEKAVVDFSAEPGQVTSISEVDSPGVDVVISLSKPAQGTGSIHLLLEALNESVAVYGTDFTTNPPAINNVLTLAVSPNETEVRFTLLPILNESCSDVFTTISIVSTGGSVKKGSNLSTTIQIENDSPIVSFSTGLLTVNENDAGIVVRLNLSRPAQEDGEFWIISLYYDLTNVYSTSPGTQFMSAGDMDFNYIPLKVKQGETSMSFTLAPIDNALPNGIREFQFFTSDEFGCLRGDAVKNGLLLIMIDDD